MIACHKDSNFQEAKQFCPERWIDASSGNFTVNVDSASIVVPFGVGRRTCPGKRFVEMEVVLLLAKVSSRILFADIYSIVMILPSPARVGLRCELREAAGNGIRIPSGTENAAEPEAARSGVMKPTDQRRLCCK